jgi:hypothetical protein
MSYRASKGIKVKQKMLDSFEGIIGGQKNMPACDLTFIESLNSI